MNRFLLALVVLLCFVSRHVLGWTMSRRGAFAAILLTPLLHASSIQASELDAKASKKFESCLSKCVFNETKPPPVGSDSGRIEIKKTRQEVLTVCKQKCATDPAQLLTGKPKIKK
jgi:hypothetical protein